MAVGDENCLGSQEHLPDRYRRVFKGIVSLSKKGLHQKLQPIFKIDSSIV